MDADTAREEALAGRLKLIDIRTRDEWAMTGVPDVALAISMNEPGFLTRLKAAVDDDKAAPIAVICASGGRSAWLANELHLAGFTAVHDVSEGMMGSTAGPGWLRRALPTRPA